MCVGARSVKCFFGLDDVDSVASARRMAMKLDGLMPRGRGISPSSFIVSNPPHYFVANRSSEIYNPIQVYLRRAVDEMPLLDTTSPSTAFVFGRRSDRASPPHA
jgi:hypothetical protein